MMLSFQVRDMRASVSRLVKTRRPPATVLIILGHAQHLGVAPKDRIEGCVSQSPDPTAKEHPPFCEVSLAELYMALKHAKGIDEPEWENTTASTSDRRKEDSIEDYDGSASSA